MSIEVFDRGTGTSGSPHRHPVQGRRRRQEPSKQDRNTSGNVNRTALAHHIVRAGAHVLQFLMVLPAVVPQNRVVDTGGLRHSCPGPPESLRPH